MKQVLQHLKAGETQVVEVPAPSIRPGHILINTHSSLISAGSERTIVEFSKGSLLAKARSEPARVQQVLDKIKTDGLIPTLEAVFAKLDEPMPLGYCNAGVVLAVGPGVTKFQPGDRVASNGPHAEIVCVPENLCAKIPDGVDDDAAAFTVISSIGLQGIRLLQPTFGESFVVYGLGLIGLACVQLLRAQGCQVLGVDIDPRRLELAAGYGAEVVNASENGDPVVVASAWTKGKGVDGVLITASAKADEIVHQSAEMCRKRGRIVLVGVVGLNLRRSDFYKKELSFQVSCSYGPGRYDDAYEERGQDYPYPYVRWTEQRNFEAILMAMGQGSLCVRDLITRRFPQVEAAKAYDAVTGDPGALGVLLEYPEETQVNRSPVVSVHSPSEIPAGPPVLGVIGAGNFSRMMMMPCLAKTPARIAYIANRNGVPAADLAKKFGAEKAISDYRLMLADTDVSAVLISTGHSSHASLICEALAAGKHVFTEKPLAIHEGQLAKVREAVLQQPDQMVMVGFNRRFSPHIQRMKELLVGRGEPLCLNMTVNAGFIDPEHPMHDPARGGGRIIGEGCHFIDLMAFLTGSKVRTVAATMVGEGVAIRDDKMSISLGFEDGSVGTVNYFGNGIKSYPKEILEVFSDCRVLRMENFRRTVGYGFRGFRKFKTARQDKGHRAEFAAFVDRVANGGEPLISFDELENVTQASFAAVRSAKEGRTVEL